MAGPNAEFSFELIDYPCLSGSSQTDFLRTYTKPPLDSITGATVAFYFEIVFTSTANVRVSLLDVTNNSVKAYVDVASQATHERAARVSFSPAGGNPVYCVRTSNTAGASVWSARIIAVVTGATGGVVQIPLARYASTATNTNTNSANLEERDSTTYGQTNTSQLNFWRYYATEWADIVASTGMLVEYVLSAQNAGYAVQAALVTAGSTTVLAGSEISADSDTSVHRLEQTVDPVNLTDNTTYALAAKSADTDAAHSMRLNRANIYLILANAAGLTKFNTYARVGHVQQGTVAITQPKSRAQMNSANFGGTGATVAYITEATAYVASGNEVIFGVGDCGASRTDLPGGHITYSAVQPGTTRICTRSAGWTAPTSGNDVCAQKDATTATGYLTGGFFVLTQVAYTAPATGCPKMAMHYARSRNS